MEKVKQKESLSVIIATRNEEEFLHDCLQSLGSIADEILVADAQSSDKTVEIAKAFHVKVLSMPHVKMFHKNKEEARKRATGDWILFLDADERLTKEGREEISRLLSGNQRSSELPEIFLRHMRMIEQRDGIQYQRDLPFNAFFIARKNYFLGRYLLHSGVYPDGVIRLVRKDRGFWPCVDVHETMRVTGGVSWLIEPMIHMADPTFSRYLARANRYTDLTAQTYAVERIPKSIFSTVRYCLFLPMKLFFSLFIRHKGFLDGYSGFVWSLMSALHPAIAFLKYLSTL